MKRLIPKKILILILCTLFCGAFSLARAATPPDDGTADPQASSYLSSYSAHIDKVGSGKIQVWFTVNGVGTMDKIGSTNIVLKESTNGTSWTTVKTFNSSSYSNMLASNKASYTSYVPYSGISGRYYQAIVTVYAAKDGYSDSKPKTTVTVKAS